MANKLKNPSEDEKRQCPAPTEKEKRQRNDDHRNADGVAQLINRMPVLRPIIFDERLGHVLFVSCQLSVVSSHLLKLSTVIYLLTTDHGLLTTNDINKDIHRSTADHSFFTCLFSR